MLSDSSSLIYELMKKTLLLIIAAIIPLISFARGPKREFRGAWLHTIYQSQYKNQTTEQNKAYLRRQLDSLQDVGVNAILFQVRPQSDAFYSSKLEPWSRFLTDGGKAPVPYWDPLEFMVEETHARGMELHAWLNPYRVTSSAKQTLPEKHIYHSHPERFVRYDGKLYFDPGIPENRQFIVSVVDDIISRYDVDGIHFDDYFYPYPVKGVDFPDSKSYEKYGNGMTRNDWRRKNVDLLIEEIHTHIAATKSWVRFGISPFGIWRNKTSDPRGSETNGLENYDSLYADVLLWEEKGWIDYLLPQLYWELNHKSASYLTLVDWWNRNAGANRHLYIGQDVERTMKLSELDRKVALTRQHDNISGNCWWPGYSITKNFSGVADSLAVNHQRHPALVPPYGWIASQGPQAVDRVKVSKKKIEWTAPELNGCTEDAVRFVVYRFDGIEDIDIDNAEAIVAVQPDKSYTAARGGVYVITALDRVNNESEPSVPVLIND